MWELVFSIPIPNWTGLVSGFCLGVLLETVLITILAIRWAPKESGREDEGIPFEEIEKLYKEPEIH
jgi:hypothetical protein